MTVPNDERWLPSPELLAAYFDGEFEGRDDLATLRSRLEDWLAVTPDARAELSGYRRLRHAWLATTPPEPGVSAWAKVQAHLEANTGTQRPDRPPHRAAWRAAARAAAVACVLLAAMLATRPNLDDSPFPVASESEVVILHVDGADAGTLVVGELPLQGPLELVGPGEVTFSSVQPAQRDNMLPEVYANGPGRPIVWARAENEED